MRLRQSGDYIKERLIALFHCETYTCVYLSSNNQAVYTAIYLQFSGSPGRFNGKMITYSFAGEITDVCNGKKIFTSFPSAVNKRDDRIIIQLPDGKNLL